MREKSEHAPPGYRRAVSAVVALACLATAYYALRLGYADYLYRSNRPQSLEYAAGLIPSQADYQARLSRLQRAVQLNPYLAAAWIEIGTRAEAQRDYSTAETALLDAARVDRTFEPRWALANFYFRRENWEDFWKWIRAAAEMSYGDRTGLFQLCWRASSDPQLILRRAIPAEPVILGEYVYFLENSEQFEAAQAAALLWLPLARRSDQSSLLVLCDILIQKAHNGPGVLAIWNALIARGWLKYEPLDPDGGASLTNGDFRVQPLQHAFDWRLFPQSGVRVVRSESQGLVFAWDGHESEQSVLLVQWMPARASSTYELSLRSQSSDLPPVSGLRWTVFNGESGATLGESSLEMPLAALRVATPPACSLVKLVVGYQRAPGVTRIEGNWVLHSVALRRATP